MYLRSFAITCALAVGLLVILALAFIMCIPAYIANLFTVPPTRPRAFASALPGGRLRS